MNTAAIHRDLMLVLHKHMPTGAYLRAENEARQSEAEYGTRSDLRDLRDAVMREARTLAESIERLTTEVNDLSARAKAVQRLVAAGESNTDPGDEHQ